MPGKILGVGGGSGVVDYPKGDGVDECSEDPGLVCHKKPAYGLFQTCDVTPVIVAVSLFIHYMIGSLLGPM